MVCYFLIIKKDAVVEVKSDIDKTKVCGQESKGDSKRVVEEKSVNIIPERIQENIPAIENPNSHEKSKRLIKSDDHTIESRKVTNSGSGNERKSTLELNSDNTPVIEGKSKHNVIVYPPLFETNIKNFVSESNSHTTEKQRIHQKLLEKHMRDASMHARIRNIGNARMVSNNLKAHMSNGISIAK
jgi:hypothetical protein